VSSEQLPEGWTPHDGGRCPVDDSTRVTVLVRDHRQPEGWSAQGVFRPSCAWHWQIDPSKTGAIIGYREESHYDTDAKAIAAWNRRVPAHREGGGA
jgi:hypothetical protein